MTNINPRINTNQSWNLGNRHEGNEGMFATMADFIAAGGAAANPGPVWIGGRQYFNGVPIKRGNRAVIVGDSISSTYHQFFQGTVSNFVVSSGVGTVTLSAGHGLQKGWLIQMTNTGTDLDFTPKQILTVAAGSFTIDASGVHDGTYNAVTGVTVGNNTARGFHVLSSVGCSNYIAVMNAKYGNPITVVGDFSWPGRGVESDGVLSSLPYAKALTPDIIFYHCGINSVDASATADAIIANIDAYRSGVDAALFVCSTLMPIGGASSAKQEVIAAVNAWIKSQHDGERFIAIDTYAMAHGGDAATWGTIYAVNGKLAPKNGAGGDFASTFDTSAQKHPSTIFHHLWAEALAHKLADILPPARDASFYSHDTDNLLNTSAQPRLSLLHGTLGASQKASGLSTGVGGGVAEGAYSLLAADGTNGFFARNGGNIQQLAATSVAAGAYTVTLGDMVSKFADDALADKWLEFGVDLFIIDQTNLQDIYAQLYLYDGTLPGYANAHIMTGSPDASSVVCGSNTKRGVLQLKSNQRLQVKFTPTYAPLRVIANLKASGAIKFDLASPWVRVFDSEYGDY